MKRVLRNIKEVKPLKHSTHRHAWVKFIMVLTVFVAYFVFVSFRYGVGEGFLVGWLTWSFFVMCTPIADAGLLIDFPLRLIAKIRMFISELFAWLVAISLNLVFYSVYPEIYNETAVLRIFKHILDNPLLVFSIVGLSAIGTFLSVKFGDELVDVIEHKDRIFKQKHDWKHNLLITAFLFILVLVVYDFLLKNSGIDILRLI
jgi:hypothetical protein